MKKHLLLLLVIVPLLSLLVSTVIAVDTHAANTCNERFFSLPAWYEGMVDENCKFTGFETYKTDAFWLIAINLLEIAFQVVAYFAVGYIIWGGFKYIKSEGNPSKIGEAKQTILYAIIGLGVALSSVAIVNFVTRSITS